MRTLLALLLIPFFAACGDDDGSPADGAVEDSAATDVAVDAAEDANASEDAGLDLALPDMNVADMNVADTGADAAMDGGAADTGADAAMDGGAADAGIDMGIADSGMACHEGDFGAPAVEFETVSALPAMTGGAIPLGTYDAAAVLTTGMLTGRYRATWTFVDDSTLESIDALATGDAPLPATEPRTQRYETSGNALMRMQTCGGDASFETNYRVFTDGGATFLDLNSGPILLRLQLRE